MGTTADHHDLVIVGGGPGGYAAALYGAAAGLDVAMVERDRVGGTCLHRGCIPAKELLETAAVYRTVRGAKEFGIDAGTPGLDLPVSQQRKQAVIDRLTKGLEGLLKGRKVTVVNGTGRLADAGSLRVAVDGAEEATELEGDAVILATGSLPRSIPGFDFDGDVILSSDHVLRLDKVPARVAVIGGGAIGCEFASFLADVGSEVTVLEALPQVLTGVDTDCANAAVRAFKKRNITIHTQVTVEGHERNGDEVTVRYSGPDGAGSVTVDKIVVSVGRAPLSGELGLDGSPVAVDKRGFVEVDPYMRTTAPEIYALGDLVATPQLAHVAFAEAIVAVKAILGEPVVPVDYAKVPFAIYCHPEVAFAGLTEQQAKDAGYDVVVSKHSFAGNGRALIHGETEGLVKVVAEKGGPLLGVHMTGPMVTELMVEGYLAVNWEALPEEVGSFIHPHPTLSETFGEAVLALTGRGLHG
ncbi:MAG TPA: dihydrolipoyl dehydrogenase [Acidimicrobiia bacterium]|nr:dihydrolipoyl dehydrogenase [Acidimicrobiia bacterium]